MYHRHRFFYTKSLAEHYQNLATAHCNTLKEKGITPSLAILLVGDNPASHIYVKHKLAAAEKIGITAKCQTLPENATLDEVKNALKMLAESDVSGILMQIPLPAHLNAHKQELLDMIPYQKDVDGLTTHNTGLLENGVLTGLKPATPLGVIRILEATQTPLVGKSVVVIGRSNLVGRPLSSMLSYADATVINCHKATDDLSFFTKLGDVVISATGVPELIDASYIKSGATLIDVGTTRTASKKLVGDMNTQSCAKKARLVTPVPGGVGPMTIASLITNVVDATHLAHGLPTPNWHAPQ